MIYRHALKMSFKTPINIIVVIILPIPIDLLSYLVHLC